MAKKLPARRPPSVPPGGNVGLLAIFAVAVLILHLVAAAVLPQATEGPRAASPTAAMLGSD
ncbi:hypothetical protein J6500_12920 [Bradyrhizobium sp. WSM 1704]|uniref:hypothetical protein n=1 Tax=Bradyrhizobium semiaridum TaxID=2821404 RepID=UPI001CE385C2|nr:hypothetical protein [Bradyrhizobium semiaridum]MCA6122792.1 hypothetical protein [Bradyrhizobium semiaridum]